MAFGSVISVISAGTALVASVAGPVITLTVARRQFNATVILAGTGDPQTRMAAREDRGVGRRYALQQRAMSSVPIFCDRVIETVRGSFPVVLAPLGGYRSKR